MEFGHKVRAAGLGRWELGPHDLGGEKKRIEHGRWNREVCYGQHHISLQEWLAAKGKQGRLQRIVLGTVINSL
jgi:hypothetical protein